MNVNDNFIHLDNEIVSDKNRINEKFDSDFDGTNEQQKRSFVHSFVHSFIHWISLKNLSLNRFEEIYFIFLSLIK
jgi:hypothetical protein